MIWLIILLIFALGIFLIFRSKTKGYKILGYVLMGCSVIFTLVILSLIGMETDVNITNEPIIIVD